MRTFKTRAGTELPLMDIKGKPYLTVQHRIMWFREELPDWSIETEILRGNEKETLTKATIRDPSGRIISTGVKFEHVTGFTDHIEKSESGSIGRALGFLGYGTQFALDLEEGERLADAPTEEKKRFANTSEVLVPPLVRTVTVSNEVEVQDSGDYVITFGKHKNKTIKELVDLDGIPKVSSYIKYLEGKAKEDKKPLGQAAADFVEAFDCYTQVSELDKAIDRPEGVSEQLARLKNQFPGVQYAPQSGVPRGGLPYQDDEDPGPDAP